MTKKQPPPNALSPKTKPKTKNKNETEIKRKSLEHCLYVCKLKQTAAEIEQEKQMLKRFIITILTWTLGSYLPWVLSHRKFFWLLLASPQQNYCTKFSISRNRLTSSDGQGYLDNNNNQNSQFGNINHEIKFERNRHISVRTLTSIKCRGFPTRMVYIYYISCLRYTILVGNPRIVYFVKSPGESSLVWIQIVRNKFNMSLKNLIGRGSIINFIQIDCEIYKKLNAEDFAFS